MAVSNQNIVKINSREPFDKTHLYSMMHTDSLQKAMCNLKGEALKLWLYCNKNQNNYQFELSQKALQSWGLKKDAYQTAKKRLIELGYLVPLREDSNILIFYEDPLSEKQIESEKQTKKESEFQIESEKPTTLSEKPTSQSEKAQRNSTIIYNSTSNNNTGETNESLPLFRILYPGVSLQDLIESGKAKTIGEDKYELNLINGSKQVVRALG